MKNENDQNQNEDQGMDNLVEFPMAANSEFKLAMQTHFNNLFMSYGKQAVLKYLMDTEGLQEVQQRTRFGRVA